MLLLKSYLVKEKYHGIKTVLLMVLWYYGISNDFTGLAHFFDMIQFWVILFIKISNCFA
ncbi:hypothetical protein C1646_691518 [Rhizophagus diaphanus]|nr:hypothetical protein C1646_691518 [Rhizophagus diaphanus] [Rhizophagus sp. MUCL 43196]